MPSAPITSSSFTSVTYIPRRPTKSSSPSLRPIICGVSHSFSIVAAIP